MGRLGNLRCKNFLYAMTLHIEMQIFYSVNSNCKFQNVEMQYSVCHDKSEKAYGHWKNFENQKIGGQ